MAPKLFEWLASGGWARYHVGSIVIALSLVSKRFGSLMALDRVSLAVGRGEILGLLGENGAGKTTLLRILAGYLGADSGSVTIAGCAMADGPVEARRYIGYLPENVPLYGEMRVQEYLEHRARLKDVPRRALSSRVAEAMDLVRIAHVRRRLLAQLSRGYRQRVGLADVLVGAPPILLLDEPMAGLDPHQLREMRELFPALARERTMVISSHILPEVAAITTRVAILVAGRVAAEGSPHALCEGHGAWLVVAPHDVDKALAALGPTARVLDLATGRLATDLSAADAARAVVTAGCALNELQGRRTLEDVFLEATR